MAMTRKRNAERSETRSQARRGGVDTYLGIGCFRRMNWRRHALFAAGWVLTPLPVCALGIDSPTGKMSSNTRSRF